MKIGSVIFLLVCSSIAAHIQVANAQLKVLEGNEISFGKIFQTGKNVHEELTLKNVGNESIRITNIHTSCGCTVASISDSLIPPGKQTKVKIEFNPTGYIGAVTKYIFIVSSDPKNQMIEVKMTGYVAYAVQPTPNYVTFYNVKLGKTDSTSITLSNMSDETLEITKIDLPSNELSYRLSRKTLKPGEFADLELYLNAKKMEDINGEMRIYTTSKLQPVLQLKLFAGIIGG
jgi:hypothetical protein